MALITPSVMGYGEVEVGRGGGIAGFVKVAGKVSRGRYLEVTKNKEVCGKVLDESLVVGMGQGVRYAAVTWR